MNILETRVDRSTAFHQKSRNRYYLKKYLTAQYTGVSRKKPQGWGFFHLFSSSLAEKKKKPTPWGFFQIFSNFQKLTVFLQTLLDIGERSRL